MTTLHTIRPMTDAQLLAAMLACAAAHQPDLPLIRAAVATHHPDLDEAAQDALSGQVAVEMGRANVSVSFPERTVRAPGWNGPAANAVASVHLIKAAG